MFPRLLLDAAVRTLAPKNELGDFAREASHIVLTPGGKTPRVRR